MSDLAPEFEQGVTMQRPTSDEYAPYYGTYVKRVPDSPIFELLASSGETTLTLIDSVPEDRLLHRYEPGKWSVKEVIGHVCDVERLFATRGLIVARGDGNEYPGFDENEYVREASFDDRSIASLRDEFAALRAASIALFETMPESWQTRTGVASGCTFSVRALVYIMAGHEIHHRGVLASRYGIGGDR